jgi:hypothetical protein
LASGEYFIQTTVEVEGEESLTVYKTATEYKDGETYYI